MPVLRNVRRSQRLSGQLPSDECDAADLDGLELLKDESASSPPPSSSAARPPTKPCPPALPSDTSVDAPAPEVVLRSSHSRKKKPGHIPRPPNAFMIFRSELWSEEKIKSTVERDHRQISRIAGTLWNGLTDAQRVPYKERADLAKQLHAQQYPDYKYAPVYRKDKPIKRKMKKEKDDDGAGVRWKGVAHLMLRGVEGDALEKEVKKLAGKGELSSPSRAMPRRVRPRPSPPLPVAPPLHVARLPPRPRPVSSPKPKNKGKAKAVVKAEEAPEFIPPDHDSDDDVMDEEPGSGSPPTSSSSLDVDYQTYSRKEVLQTPEFSFPDLGQGLAFAQLAPPGTSNLIPRGREWPIVSSYDPNFVDSIYSGLKPSAVRALVDAEAELRGSGASLSTNFNFLTSDFANMSMDRSPTMSPEDVFEPALFPDELGFSLNPLVKAEVSGDEEWEHKEWFEM